ncbi:MULTISPECIES: PP2C family protein-serine/threonine phosphatase [Streptacidiphilus]|uniref:PP2C family protein-serine/threonine phosphatase n=1 Tax=Streptacidiphilus cavernicola TaxID=3342716 RepID=A0ABV6V1D5_9ACTN|nr:PP2C family protein-serine/threonine phosphatase [Streptacidiphilus jeojiense]
MAVVTVLDLMAGPDTGYLPLFSLGPAFACVAGSVRRSLLVGALAWALCLSAAGYDGLLLRHRATVALVSIAGVTAAAALAAAIRRSHERELADVRSVAEAAQRVLLRPVPRHAGHMRIAVSYTSAAAEARIGGDLYEVVPTPTGARVIVGDVQGKGLDAVETAAVVLGAFREAAPEEKDLETVGNRIERALNRRLEGEEFVTAVLAEIDTDHGVTLLNYGHPAPLLLRADGTVEPADPDAYAPPLGLASLGPQGPTPHKVQLAQGDQMLLYTDGVTEARNRHREFYPLAQRAHLLDQPDPERALETLRRDLVAYTHGPLHDDAAMLLLRYRATPEAPNIPADRTHQPSTAPVAPDEPPQQRRHASTGT